MLREKTQAKNDGDRPAVCSGCGAETLAIATKLCTVCGKLMSEGFQPLDALRSSYRLQRRELPTARPNPVEQLFQAPRSSIAETAWACTVYSMVPYLGILFIPVALGFSGFGYFTARSESEGSDGDSTLISAGVSLILLGVQIFLWWLLYIIPEIGAVPR